MKKLLFLVLALFLVPIVSAQLEISDKIVKNTRECATRKMTDEEKIKYCCK